MRRAIPSSVHFVHRPSLCKSTSLAKPSDYWFADTLFERAWCVDKITLMDLWILCGGTWSVDIITVIGICITLVNEYGM